MRTGTVHAMVLLAAGMMMVTAAESAFARGGGGGSGGSRATVERRDNRVTTPARDAARDTSTRVRPTSGPAPIAPKPRIERASRETRVVRATRTIDLRKKKPTTLGRLTGAVKKVGCVSAATATGGLAAGVACR